MKKLFYLLLVFGILFTVSCKKEPLEKPPGTQWATIPLNPGEEAVEEGISIYGTWRLIGGTMYIEDLDNGSKYAYDHFSSTQTTSSLRYEGTIFTLESISVNSTTWTFIEPLNGGSGTGRFILNGDSENPYGFNVSASYWSIIEDGASSLDGPITIKLGGSSRPLRAVVANYGAEEVYFYIQEGYEVIDGHNCKYFSELKFKKIS